MVNQGYIVSITLLTVSYAPVQKTLSTKTLKGHTLLIRS